jgi:hypothetical protein
MKIASVILGLAICLTIGLVVAQQGDAGADPLVAAVVTASLPAQPVSVVAPEPDTLAKKCSFNSDCPYGTCKGGQCGGCSFNSDCKGWGVCKGGQCGACSFNSDCKGFGDCSSGNCTKSPY